MINVELYFLSKVRAFISQTEYYQRKLAKTQWFLAIFA